MIFIDSNVPMYLVGGSHPHHDTARRVLERLVAETELLVTSAEVFQEILHRYVAIRRLEALDPAFEALRGVVDEVVAIELEDVERARSLVIENAGLSARDALHVAVMEREGIERILSFDTGFDQVDSITRIAD